MLAGEIKECILIDDDSDDREFFEYALSQLLYSVNVKSFSNFDQAISLIHKESIKPHYIFVDSILPGLDHERHLYKLKTIKDLTKAPIIILSSSDPEFSKQKFKNVLIHDFLQKQSSLDELKDMLHDFFQRNP